VYLAEKQIGYNEVMLPGLYVHVNLSIAKIEVMTQEQEIKKPFNFCSESFAFLNQLQIQSFFLVKVFFFKGVLN